MTCPKSCRVAAALFLAVPGMLQAQNFEKIGPKPPIAPNRAAILPEEKKGTDLGGAASGEVLVGKLRALVLEGAQETGNMESRGEMGPMEASSGVSFAGVTPPEPDKLSQQLAGQIGRPVSMASIKAMVVEIIQFYRAHDRPLVDVTIPEQDITGGVLHLAILESRLGAVRAQKNRWFSGELLEAGVRCRPGEPIVASRLLQDLQWLNNNPFRQVNAIYTPGTRFGTTDLLLETQDRFPVRFYTGYENSGPSITGNDRWLAGFNWGNVFGLDQLLSYQFTTSDDFQSSLSHSFSYNIPLPWRHTLLLFGSFSQSDSPVVVDLQSFNSGGVSSQASFRYSVPLPGTGPLKHELFTGFDFKRSNNNLDFGGIRVFDKNTDIFQWLGGYEGQMRDRWGVTILNATGFYSPGNLNANNSDAVFDESRKGARADYWYGRLSLERLNRLPAEWSLDLRATAQLADGNLLASEQIALGGSGSVRGYREDASRGDAGLLVSAELRTPPIKLLRRIEDQLQFIAFLDYGTGRLDSPLPGEPGGQTLASGGLGFRYLLAPYLSIRCDYGWQLLDIGGEHDSLGSFGVTLSY